MKSYVLPAAKWAQGCQLCWYPRAAKFSIKPQRIINWKSSKPTINLPLISPVPYLISHLFKRNVQKCDLKKGFLNSFILWTKKFWWILFYVSVGVNSCYHTLASLFLHPSDGDRASHATGLQFWVLTKIPNAVKQSTRYLLVV